MREMKWRRLICGILSIFVLNMYVGFSYTDAASYSVSISRSQQQKSNWCWAACAEMLARYYQRGVSQTSIVTAVKGKNVNETASYAQVASAIQYATRRRTTYEGRISFSAMESKIRSGKPFVLRMEWNSGGGHVVVVSGTNSNAIPSLNQIRLVDPAVGASTNWYYYDTLVYGFVIQSGAGHYSHTFTTGSILSTK